MLAAVASPAAHRHAPWSSSKLQTATRCAREFHYRYVERLPEIEVSPEARIGKGVHKALENALRRMELPAALASGRALLESEEERARFQALAPGVERFLARVDAFRARRRVRSELVEHRLGLDASFGPAGFSARGVFFRGVLDAVFVYDDGVLAVLDHKTGARREGVDHMAQLESYAALAAAHFAGVRRLWLGVHYVAEAEVTWAPPVDLAEVTARMLPRLEAAIEAAGLAVAEGPVPRVSPWCQRCSYRSICPAVASLPAGGSAAAAP